MKNVYFYPDVYSEADDLFEVIGKPKYAHYIEVDEIEKFLINYLCVLNKFPVYLTLSSFRLHSTALVALLKASVDLTGLGRYFSSIPLINKD